MVVHGTYCCFFFYFVSQCIHALNRPYMGKISFSLWRIVCTAHVIVVDASSAHVRIDEWHPTPAKKKNK